MLSEDAMDSTEMDLPFDLKEEKVFDFPKGEMWKTGSSTRLP